MQGTFIVLEGTDGSGKGTQFQLLGDQLRQAGYDVALFDFPQYGQPSSYFVQEYLNGHYGSAEQIGPYTASLFYALDRFDAAEKIHDALEAGKIVLANRFTGSSMAHQGTKFRDAGERRGYFVWLDNLEHEMLKIPRPSLNIVLRVPADIAQQLVAQKEKRGYTDKTHDIHEADMTHLQRSVEVYDDMCQLFPKDFRKIDCVRDDALLGIEAVNALIRETIQPLLPKPPSRAPQPKQDAKSAEAATTAPPSVAATADDTSARTEPKVTYLRRQGQALTATQEGEQYLDAAVTDRKGAVYAFTGTIAPATVALAFSRLRHRSEDLRTVLLDEFAQAQEKDGPTLQAGDRSSSETAAERLTGLHLVVEDASNLLAKKIEWSRGGAYVEHSACHTYLDQKDAKGKYKYYTPEGLNRTAADTYKQSMDAIFDRYAMLVRQLTGYVREHSDTPQGQRDKAWRRSTRSVACDAVRAVLPVATRTTIGISVSAESLSHMSIRLQADDLPEARSTATELLGEARKVAPAVLEQTDTPEGGGATSAYLANSRRHIRELAASYLPDNHMAAPGSGATLTDVWPRNETDLLADMLYEHSNLSLRALRDEIDRWPYDRKTEVFQAYFGERLTRQQYPGRALEKARYSWDIVCDYDMFRELQRHHIVDDLGWQELTPRYGYDTPPLVEAAGLSDLYDDCFDISLRLHSRLQQDGYRLEAQYATLLGHRMRWKATYDGRELLRIFELRSKPGSHPGYRELIAGMYGQLGEVHPLMAEGMKFVGRDDDPELTKLAVERSAEYRLRLSDSKKP